MHHNSVADSAMWTDVVTDHDAVEHQQHLARATVALAGTWPFLAASKSNEEFEHRLALMAEQIEGRTEPHIREEVVAHLRTRFQSLLEERLTSTAIRRTAARLIALAEGETALPQAYVHVHKHSAEDNDGEYYQIDHVASPTHLQTIGHKTDRDDAMQTARELALPNGLPIYENGRYVEGRKLASLFANDEEFLDEQSGRWVKASSLPNVMAAGLDSNGHAVPPAGVVKGHYIQHNGGWHEVTNILDDNDGTTFTLGNGQHTKTVAPDEEVRTMSPREHQQKFMDDHFKIIPVSSLQATAHQTWAPGGNALHPAAGLYDERMRAQRQANWGDSLAPAEAGSLKDMTYHEQYGDVSREQLRAYKKFNVSPSDHWDMEDHFGKSSPEVSPRITQHVVQNSQEHGMYSPGWGWQRNSAYQPDADQAWRYHYPAPFAGEGQGGQPTATGQQGVANPFANGSTGPDGFPIDIAAGEGAGGAAKIQEQITPGAWTVTPGTEWPVRPNAADPNQVPRTAGVVPPFARSAGDTARISGSRECDIHKYMKGEPGVPAAYDGKTVHGPWANMCEDCFQEHGVGLGTGKGQRFVQARRVTAGYTNDDLHTIQSRDPSGGEVQPTQADYDNHKRWAIERFGKDAWDHYSRGGWDNPQSYASLRRRATEGIVPTPGPNPNYFSQGTQGIQGPGEFPENPSGDIEPKTNNNMDDGVYSDSGPSPVSPGSSQGQVDDAGYTRQSARKNDSAYLTMSPAGVDKGYPAEGHEVHMHHGDDHFQVGWWPTPQSARKNGEDYGRIYGRSTPSLGRKPITFREASRSRLGFSRGSASRQEEPERPKKKTEVADRDPMEDARRAVDDVLGDRLDDEDALSDNKIGPTKYSMFHTAPGGGEHAPYRIKQEGGKYFVVNDRGEKKDQGYSTHDEAREHQKALYANVPGAAESAEKDEQRKHSTGNYDRDFEEGKDHAYAGMSPFAVHSQPSRGYLDGHAAGTEDYSEMDDEDRNYWADRQKRRTAAREPFGDQHVENYLAWARSKGHDSDSVAALKAYENEPGIGRAHTNHIADQLYIGGGEDNWRSNREASLAREAATNGQIVGMCDHCNLPVRYHDDNGGHLRHLHNNSHRCNDGRVATAVRVDFGDYEARFELNPFIDKTAHTDGGDQYFRAVQGANRSGACEFCGGRATHSLQVSNGHGMSHVADACTTHAGQYDNQRAASLRHKDVRVTSVDATHRLVGTDRAVSSLAHVADLHAVPARNQGQGCMVGSCSGPATHTVFNGDRRIGTACDQHADEVKLKGRIGAATRNEVECPNCKGWGAVNLLQNPQVCSLCNGHQRVSAETKREFIQRTRRQGAVLENPSAENPTGQGGDPYRARTEWHGFEQQRPRQRLEDMNSNTPITPGDQIKTGPNANTPQPGAHLDEDGPRERGDEDDEDD